MITQFAEYGLLGLVLLFLGWGLVRICKFLGGLLTNYFQKQSEVMVKISKTLDSILKRLDHIDQRLEIVENRSE